MILLLTPIFLQSILILWDEFHFHHKRGLPLWEKIGHPFDTFTVIICYLFLVLNSANSAHLKIYIGLCSLSCLIITKDEFVHSELCDSMENWIHSLLFILHPITFLCAGIIWLDSSNPIFLKVQLIVLNFFMIYQIVYWRMFGKS